MDLNTDIAELPELWENGVYTRLMDHIDSINIACGAHAGDPDLIRKVAKYALERRLRIGAHPGYPDRENFGRKPMEMSEEALFDSLRDQILLVKQILEEIGASRSDPTPSLTHVKVHGALYHQVSTRPEYADILIEVVKSIDPDLRIVSLAGSPTLVRFEEAGLKTWSGGFADRTYEANGQLRSRNEPNAMISDPLEASEQVKRMRYESVRSWTGEEFQLRVDTVCIHSDSANAVKIAEALRSV